MMDAHFLTGLLIGIVIGGVLAMFGVSSAFGEVGGDDDFDEMTEYHKRAT